MSEHDGPGSSPLPGQGPPSPGPAGWYPDPWAQAEQRWFDGTQWTPSTQPAVDPGAGASAAWGAPAGAPTSGGWGYGPPQPVKKSRVGLIVACAVAGVVVVLAGLGTIGYLAFKDDAAFAKVGDCIDLNLADAEASARKLSCDNPAAVSKVALRIDRANASCPNENYDFYSEDTIGDFTLCMTLNAKAGDCFIGNDTDTSRIPCGPRPQSEGFVIRVDRVLEGVNSAAQCKATNPSSEGITYPQPPLTICFVPIEPSR